MVSAEYTTPENRVPIVNQRPLGRNVGTLNVPNFDPAAANVVNNQGSLFGSNSPNPVARNLSSAFDQVANNLPTSQGDEQLVRNLNRMSLSPSPQ